MSIKHQHIHGREQEQGVHSHHHTSGHGHFGHARDSGSRMMGFLALLSHVGHIEGSLSNYRTRRLVPASDKMIVGTILVLAAGVVLWYFLPAGIGSTVVLVIAIAAAVHLAVLVIGGLVLTLFIRHIRSEARQSVLGSIRWRGDEKVLDVACGTGMLLNACAGKLTTGKATGIDMWQEPVAGSPSVLAQNAKAEGVVDRVEYHEMDARQLTFPDASFDMVVSSFALHHIDKEAGDLDQALGEMVRMLAPGGTVTLLDIAPMIDTAEQMMRQTGLQSIRREPRGFFHLVTAQK